MEILFLLLVSSSLVWVVYGLISPENALPFLKNPSRLKVLGIFTKECLQSLVSLQQLFLEI